MALSVKVKLYTQGGETTKMMRFMGDVRYFFLFRFFHFFFFFSPN
jgi:hypothetical protein